MATFRKRGDKWQARVQRSGQGPISKSFHTKPDAVKWARNIESQLDRGTFAPKQTMPRLMPLIVRYVEEVKPTKKGESQERYRAAQWKKTKLADMQLDKITGEVVAQYRGAEEMGNARDEVIRCSGSHCKLSVKPTLHHQGLLF